MKLQTARGQLLPAREAQELASRARLDPAFDVDTDQPAQNTAPETLSEEDRVAGLNRWRKLVNRMAAMTIQGIDHDMFHLSRDKGLTHTDYIEAYYIKDLTREARAYVTATADMVTHAIVEALQAEGYKTKESSGLIRDKYTGSREDPDYYRVEVAIDWDDPDYQRVLDEQLALNQQ